MDDTASLTLAADQVTPVRAYAALRSFATQQTSFLFESLVSPEKGGRYSIIGYRAQSESLYPPGGDALAMLAQELAESEAPPSATARPPAESLARRLSRAIVGYVTYDAVHPIHKIKPWESEGPMARLIQGSTVVVFDHLAQTCTIAGPTRASVNRCAAEMNRGPDLRLLRAPDLAASPEHVEAAMSDETFAARVRRAAEHIARGEITRLVLARTFRTPPRNADPFDIYRALRVLSPRPFHFFLDFVETPMVPAQLMLGASDQALLGRDETAGAGSAAGERLRAAFPSEAIVGSPRTRAAQLIRELEVESRGNYGGAIGYILPDGELEMVVAQRMVVLQDAYLEVAGGATIVAGSDPAAAAAETRHEANFALAAIRAAQDAADAREAADAEKRAKEEAQKAASAGDESAS
ncbi:MAG: chorismate-binding protein [Minicystis sp.]